MRRKAPSHQEVLDWQARLRSALFEAVSEDDIREIAAGLVRKAKDGDLAAARMLFNFTMGGPTVRVNNALIYGGGSEALNSLPTAPTGALPRSAEKLSILERRAANGQSLHDPRDRKFVGGEEDR